MPHPRHAVGAGRIARRDLPHLAHALEVADVEGIQAHELARLARLDVAGSVLGTLVYAPFKATFCILGGITSGFTFPFAGADTAGRVATTCCGGARSSTGPATMARPTKWRSTSSTAASPRSSAESTVSAYEALG